MMPRSRVGSKVYRTIEEVKMTTIFASSDRISPVWCPGVKGREGWWKGREGWLGVVLGWLCK